MESPGRKPRRRFQAHEENNGMNFLFVLFALAFQAPQAAPPPPCTPGGTQYICGQQAPEDLVLVPNSDWVIASVFAGSGGIRLINTRDKSTTTAYPSPTSKEQFDRKTYNTCPGPPDAAEKAMFRTHGLALRAGRNSVHALYAVHHGGRESIEVLDLHARGKPPTLTWVGCAVAPEPVGLNSVVALPEGGFAATNFLARNVDAGARGKMLAGENNGEIWEWHTGTGWKIIPGSEASGANGLEVSKDGKWLYVAAWGGRLSSGCRADRRRRSVMPSRSVFASTISDGRLMVRSSVRGREARLQELRPRTS